MQRKPFLKKKPFSKQQQQKTFIFPFFLVYILVIWAVYFY